MASKVPSVIFNNGLKCPILGLGTWKSQPGEVVEAVKAAIDIGYRHIDCAHIYQNEKEVGVALNDRMTEGVVKREDLFITSKLWNTYHKEDLVKPALDVTLSNLGLEYLDLYLIHWPTGFKEGEVLVPRDDNNKILYSDSYFTETWRAMEECAKAGLTKSIGLSNFNSKQIDEILSMATIKPVTNQVESHVYLNQSKLFDFCKSHQISLTAYSPLGSPDRPGPPEIDLTVPLKDTKVAEVAAKYDKSPAQILIKFHLQRGIIVIPKSVNKSRIQSNFEVFDFEISPEDMKELEALDCNGRFLAVKWNMGHKDYPFHGEF